MFGLTKTIKKVFGDKSTKDYKAEQHLIEKCNEEFAKLDTLSDDELRAKTDYFKSIIKSRLETINNEISALEEKGNDKSIDIEEKERFYEQIDALVKQSDEELELVLLELLPEAFAVVKETARRLTENETLKVTATQYDRDLAASKDFVDIDGDTAIWKNSWEAAGNLIQWNMIHYDVQLFGGIVLHKGKIAEMQTGEGKTLVATLPVYLNALSGKGVHLVTVNNYLALRDAEWMGPIFQFHGMTIDVIDKTQSNSPERRKAYKADITYGTNNEFGFDYLRDNMTSDPNGLVQRKHHFAIVDEVDSVLVDDARTPLIISGPVPKGDIHEFNELKPKVERLIAEQKKLTNTFLTDSKKLLGNIDDGKVNKEDLTNGGLALFRAYRGLPKHKALIKFMSEPGIKSHMLKTEAFYMQDSSKEMYKADEPLFFTIDEKSNSIEMTEKGIDLISGADDPDFFIMPNIGERLVDLENSGLADDELVKQKSELMRDYSIKSERIHTINQLLKAYALFEKDVEYIVVDNKVKIVDEQTGRMMEGRRYSDGLHQAIESKENVKVEAATQTYATVTLQNFFRMYHKLAGMTGTAETEAGEFWDIYKLDVVVIPTNRPISRDDRNDLVYKTQREKYNAIIDEVVNLQSKGRPVLVGTTNVEISELLSKALGMRKIKHNVLNAKRHQHEADVVAEAGKTGTVTIATNMAGRGTDIKLSEEVKAAGGLAIIGTERHDSRRVDRQLRGRAGRQGDPGSSQFFVSLEDHLMRLFGSDRISKMMDRMGHEDGEVIQHSMISKSIERAQTKVEENNFGVRKKLLEYDDVMNTQREAVYKRRRNALQGKRIAIDIANIFYDLSETISATHHDTKDYENFQLDLARSLSIEAPISEDDLNIMKVEDIIDKVYHASYSQYKNKTEVLAQKVFPVIKNVYENEREKYKNIVIPLTDGMKTMNLTTNLEQAYTSNASNVMEELEKSVTLGFIDNKWKDHLREMDDLRQSVQYAGYEQKDPLLIYKLESFDLFKSMSHELNDDIGSFLVKASLPASMGQVKQVEQKKYEDLSKLKTSRADVGGSKSGQRTQGGEAERPKVTQPIRSEKKVGRNDACPCGSGKKYKKCHGKTVVEA
ncbi:MAG: preprotein translocase subunit SecA [Patiriisocius sp.]|jgi:preprotein translocase subunit SecA